MGDVSGNWCEPDINHLPSNDRGFLWMPYSAVNIATLIPQRIHAEAPLWNTWYDRRPEMHSCMFDFSPSTEYMQWYMNRWRVYLYGGQLMIVPGHGYRRGNQPTVEVEDQHMVEPDSEDQVLNTSEQWVDTFCDESQSSSYNLDIGGSSSYHSDMGGSSSYHPDIGGLSPFDLEQPPTSVDMFGNNMYSTPPQATIDPVANPSDVYNTPQRPPRQQRPVNCYTLNDDTTPGSFQF
ncbi:hypothetical protein GOBAR_AA11424 [Gossypium barbadense]|uniref:Aminotransferase-like plant mobile domain-containing protein n=1 Tax=Gossypium barbadense TaxID=3634 RepID=A0A2P5Y0W7_GOSBA|nr:hypothetical protein GOBAR_AA11424 [Gossypium barbadense]